MKINYKALVLIVIVFAVIGCRKYSDDYKAFLDNHEVIYPGLVTNSHYNTGNLRAQLYFNPSPDPSITRYSLSWNNGADSMIVNATTHDPKDTIKVIVPSLKEYVYSFKIVAFDDKGNRSVGQEINNVRVYGGVYQATLLNRSYSLVNPYVLNGDGSVTVNFEKADSTNLSTTVQYTDNNGELKEGHLKKLSASVTLPNYKTGSLIKYKSYYLPEQTAIDSFAVSDFDEVPILANKSLFAPLRLPGDIGSAYGWELQYLWDNNFNEPGFHTPGQTFPFWFSLDMGVRSTLTGFKMYQRMGGSLYNAGNAKRFELWGSNDPDPNGSFDSWTKIATYTSTKPSGKPVGDNTNEDVAFAAAGEYFPIPAGTPEVRYIRIKVLDTWSGSAYFHALELNFYKQNR
ncbi:hypothetical protein EWM62_08785 [Mucilaginibacter terrigena]|uniref:F5/8 type C domain-containing protein n=1 Tax=Mucilaginibacter terrigena TaxID=2492395 RepID=A0A4Q5LLU4_9SPHI|nr:DUF4998 domain-containing protein [Mucilaginibacter terrigena]RYU90731.1 hypothetical protein EWM62_08785 [Mucilaginibacter terrigena]